MLAIVTAVSFTPISAVAEGDDQFQDQELMQTISDTPAPDQTDDLAGDIESPDTSDEISGDVQNTGEDSGAVQQEQNPQAVQPQAAPSSATPSSPDDEPFHLTRYTPLSEDTGTEITDSAEGNLEDTVVLDAAEANLDLQALGDQMRATSEGTPLPVTLDGTVIETLDIVWISSDTSGYDDGDPDHLNIVTNSKDEVTSRYQINFSLSGEFSYRPGDVVFTIPATIWKDRNGNDYGTLTLSVPEDPESRAPFNYRLITDETTGESYYLITNTRTLDAGAAGMFQFTVRGINPVNIVDSSDSKPLSTVLTITTREGNELSATSDSIDASINTNERVSSADKRRSSVYAPGSAPASVRALLPEGEDPADYVFVQWQTYAFVQGNQYYDLDVADPLRLDGSVRYADGTSEAVTFEGYMFDTSAGTTTEEFEANVATNTWRQSGSSHYQTVWTAYKVSDFPTDAGTTLTFNNTATWTLTPVDGIDSPTTARASATATYSIPVPPKPIIPEPYRPGYISAGFAKQTNTSRNAYSWSVNDSLNQLYAGRDVDVSYSVYSNDYLMGYTIAEGGDPNDPASYGQRKVTVELVDDAVYLAGDYTDELTADDMFFSRVDLYAPYSYRWALGSNGKYGYVSGGNKNFIVNLYGTTSQEGGWTLYATYNTSTGRVTTTNGASASGTTVYLPGQDIIRVKAVTTTNADGIHFQFNPTITYKATSQRFQQLIADSFEENDRISTNTRNDSTLLLYYDDCGISATDDVVDSSKLLAGTGSGSSSDYSRTFELDQGKYGTTMAHRSSYAYFKGYMPEVGVYLNKTCRMLENDVVAQQAVVRYTATMREQTNVLSLDDLYSTQDAGLLDLAESGVWYDLLPEGLSPNLSTLTAGNGARITDYRTIDDYNHSGRMLLIVKVDLGSSYSYNSSGTYWSEGYYHDTTITFDGTYKWETLNELGPTLDNYIAFESNSDVFGTVDSLSGEEDDPTGTNHGATQSVFRNAPEEVIRAMTDLDPDDEDGHLFVYAHDTTKLSIDTSAVVMLSKRVTTAGMGYYTDGLFGECVVYEDGYYTYRLSLATVDDSSTTEDIILFDSLDNFVPTEDHMDYGEAQWRGEFVSVDTSELEEIGVAPVVYYSTTVDASVLTPELCDLSDTSKWSTTCPDDTSTVTAIAIDCSKATDGSDFALRSDAGPMRAYVRMHAPDLAGCEAQNIYADSDGDGTLDGMDPSLNSHAYNNVYLASTNVTASGAEIPSFVHQDYTEVGIVPFTITVTKAWDDNNDNDGKRPDVATVSLLQNGQEASYSDGTPVESAELSDDNEWTYTWRGLPGFDEEGNELHYTFDEDNVEGYSMSLKIDDATMHEYTLTNVHEPERVRIAGSKTWSDEDNEAGARPGTVSLTLYADYGNGPVRVASTSVRPASNGTWNYDFGDLARYRNGNEIIYTVEETYVPGYVAEYDGYESITNSYDPFCDLKIVKTVENVTPTAAETLFPFTVYLYGTDVDDNGETIQVPLADTYAYTIFNADGSEASTGEVGTGDTLEFKGGQYAVIFDIPSDGTYEIVEGEVEGFRLTSSKNETGILKAGDGTVASFTNTYDAQGSVQMVLDKEVDGAELEPNQFRFRAYEVIDGEEQALPVSTATNDRNGTAYLGRIRYTLDDLRQPDGSYADSATFTYVIREQQESLPGYTYDQQAYTATVTVTDNGDGNLSTSVVYTDEEGNDLPAGSHAAFTNVYNAEGDLPLRAWKTIANGSVEPDQFTFNLELLGEGEAVEQPDSEEGETPASYTLAEGSEPTTIEEGVANGEGGTVAFSPIHYTQYDVGHTFIYRAAEQVPDGLDVNDDGLPVDENGVVYSAEPVYYLVTVTDNRDGTLSFAQTTATYDETTGTYTESKTLPLFVNGMEDGALSITKYTTDTTGQADPDQEFIFHVVLSGSAIEDGDSFGYTLAQVPNTVPSGTDADGADDGNAADGNGTQSAGPVLDAQEGPDDQPQASAESPAGANPVLSALDALFGVETAYAAPADGATITNRGTSGSCTWEIYSDGTFVLRPTSGSEGTLATFPTSSSSYGPPWLNYASSIKSVEIQGTVHAGQSLYCMFYKCSNLESIDLNGLDTSATRDMRYMFSGCSSLETLDVSCLDTSQARQMGSMFSSCTSLKSINLTGLDTSRCANWNYMFQDDASLESLDLSSLYVNLSAYVSSPGIWSISGMFLRCTSLKEVILGPKFRFNGSIYVGTGSNPLPTPTGDDYTGRWVNYEYSATGLTPAELSVQYNGNIMAGTWVWEPRNAGTVITFVGGDGASGSMAAQLVPNDTATALNPNTFTYFDHEFQGWATEEGGEVVYTDGQEVTWTATETTPLTLYAVWEPIEHNVTVTDGAFDIALHGGEQATIPDLPAGTTYTVYEETPDGWVLVAQSGASGTIEPLTTAEAWFANDYQPGTTTAALFATKALDNQPASEGAFSFLLEAVEGEAADGTAIAAADVPMPTGADAGSLTVTNAAGGSVAFGTITYTAAGSYVYAISEEAGSDTNISYDGTTYYAKVTVTETEDGLTSSVAYYSDASCTSALGSMPAFKNWTVPGSLVLTKIGEGISDANADDEFTFTVTFTNANGVPVDPGNVSYYIESAEAEESGESADDTADGTDGNSSTDPTLEGQEEPMVQSQAVGDDVAEAHPFIALLDGLFGVETAYAAPADGATVTNSGTFGVPAFGTDVIWELYDDGTLVIRPQDGVEGTCRGYAEYNSVFPIVGIDSLKTQVKRVEVQGTVHVSGSLCSMFRGFTNLESVDLTGLETSGVTSMIYMFYEDIKLTSITWGDGFDTGNVTRMDSMFGRCLALVSLDVSGFDTGEVTSMSNMFYDCRTLASIDVSGFDTKNVTSMSSMFCLCQALTSLDLSSWDTSSLQFVSSMFSSANALESIDVSTWDTSHITSMFWMFSGCRSLTSLDVSNWDTSHVTDMRSTFGLCSSLTSLDVSNWDTSKVTNMNELFEYCSSLTSLDLSNWDTSKVSNMTDTFKSCTSLARVDLGKKFKFVGTQSALPTPSGTGYTGNWIDYGRLAPGEGLSAETLRATYDGATMAGTWVWEIDTSRYRVDYDAMGGTSERTADIVSINKSVDLPSAQRWGYKLTGWNTEEDGSGRSYQPGDQFTGAAGTQTTLYAQWEESDERPYTVQHYQQSLDGSGYTLADTESLVGDKGTSVTPPVKEYEGYASPAPQTVTISDDEANPTVVKYYYDLTHYTLALDPNGGEGEMDDIPMTGLVSAALPANTYTREGYFFTGWNTEADGSGKAYADGASVVNLAGDGETATLYAQWAEAIVPPSETEGSFTITLHAGERAVFPSLPAGTSYTITENTPPAGWTQTDSEGTDGTIVSATTSQASVTNTYAASGVATIEATKALNGGVVESDQFSFELVDADGAVVSTASCGDQDEETGTAPVTFETLTYTETGTYTYTIREVAGSDSTIVYDDTTYTATVTVTDAGSGTLVTEVTYADENGDPVEAAAFENELEPGGFSITKVLENATSVSDDTEFEFTVTLTGSDGNELSGLYPYAVTEEGSDEAVSEGLVASGGTVAITGGQTVTITGLPHGATYEVSEGAAAGFTQVSSSGAKGTVRAGQTTEASFTNRYDAEGTVTLAATKNMTGRNLADGDFSFALIGPDGVVIETVECAADGTVEFSPLAFTTADVGESYTYRISEVDDGEPGVVYDSHTEAVTVTVEDNGDGTLAVNAAYDEDGAEFENFYEAKGTLLLTATKTLTGRAMEAGQFEFQLKDADGNVVGTAVNDARGNVAFDAVEFDQEVLKQSDGTYADSVTLEYTVTEENTGIGGYTYDDATNKVTITISDNGDGTLAVGATLSEDDEATDTITFTNSYAASGSIKLSATKVLTGHELAEGQFTFELRGPDGAVLDTAENDADGNVTFDAIVYTEVDAGKAFTYSIAEVIPEDAVDNILDGYTYDGTVVDVTVAVTDNGDGTLSATAHEGTTDQGAEIEVGEDGYAMAATFNNAYNATGSIQVTATKILKGTALKAGQFSFELKDADGNVLQTVSNDAEGNVTFDAITYTQDDVGETFTYTVSEVAGSDSTITYDKSVYTVVVTPTDNGDGTLTCEVAYSKNGSSVEALTFENTYTSPPPPDSGKTYPTPKTGDKILNTTYAFIVFALVGLALIGLSVRNRRKPQGKHLR